MVDWLGIVATPHSSNDCRIIVIVGFPGFITIHELTEHVVKSLQELCIVMQSKSAVSHTVKAVVPKSKLMFQIMTDLTI